MSWLWNREPVATVALVQAALMLAITFGLKLTAEQVGLIGTLLAAVLGWVVRGQVASPSTLMALTRKP